MIRSLGAVVALVFGLAMSSAAAPQIADGAACVRFSATHFDATGNDNTNRNGEWVRIKNYCSSAKLLSGWTIHDQGATTVYTFRAGLKIGSGASITLYTGSGTNTSTKRFWGRTKQVWDNTSAEHAYLKNAAGSLQSKSPGSSSSAGTGGGATTSNCHSSYSGVCLKSGIGDYDCAAGSGNGPNYIAGPFMVVGPDEFDLDRDGDGVGCESG